MFIEKPANKTSISGRKTILGVGINDADYVTQDHTGDKIKTCPFYRRWKNMLQRCYSEKFQKQYPTYKDCSVCDEWLLFSTFKNWMIKQDWQGKHLDKDILITGNKIYSPETCLFVTLAINNILLERQNDRGALPLGVSLCDRRKRYAVKRRYKGKYVQIGTYMTTEEASQAYDKFKSKIVHETALEQSEPLRSALIRISKEILINQTAKGT